MVQDLSARGYQNVTLLSRGVAIEQFKPSNTGLTVLRRAMGRAGR